MQGKEKAKSKTNKPAKGLELMAGGKYRIDTRRTKDKMQTLRNNKGQIKEVEIENSLSNDNVDRIIEGLEEYVRWCHENEEVPLKAEFCYRWLGIHKQRLSEWVKLSRPIAEAVKTIEDFQETYCVKKGFKMRNPAHAIFMLKANHGYQETSKIEHKHNITVNVTDFDQSSMIEAEYKEKKV